LSSFSTHLCYNYGVDLNFLLEGVRLNEENTCSSKKLNDFFSEGEEIEVSRKKKKRKFLLMRCLNVTRVKFL